MDDEDVGMRRESVVELLLLSRLWVSEFLLSCRCVLAASENRASVSFYIMKTRHVQATTHDCKTLCRWIYGSSSKRQILDLPPIGCVKDQTYTHDRHVYASNDWARITIPGVAGMWWAYWTPQ